MGQYLLHGELKRLVLLCHEGVAVDDVKDFRRRRLTAEGLGNLMVEKFIFSCYTYGERHAMPISIIYITR